MLKGDRILLRLVEHRDAAMILAWEQMDELVLVTEANNTPSMQVMQQLIDEQRNVLESGQIRFVMCLLDSNLPIGLVDLYNIDFIENKGEIGIVVVSEKNREKGYAGEGLRMMHTYARDVLGIQYISARVDNKNKASNALFISLGYELEKSIKITEVKNKFKIMLCGM